MLRFFLIVAGLLLVLDTVVIKSLTTGNLGTYLPAIIGLPLLLIGLFFPPLARWFLSPGLGVFAKWLLLCGYAAAALFFLVLGSLIYKEGHQKAPEGADAVIVLGAGLRGDRVSLTLAYRLDAAHDYLSKNPSAMLILSGGQGENETIPEALAMKRYLMSRGVNEDRLIVEDRSTSTYENFLFSRQILRERFSENAKVVFVTTDFHVYRAGLVAKSMGLTLAGLGAKGVWYLSPNDTMRECVALTMYWLKGRL